MHQNIKDFLKISIAYILLYVLVDLQLKYIIYSIKKKHETIIERAARVNQETTTQRSRSTTSK